MGAQVEFVKGHGTQNDFVLVPDPDGVSDGVVDPPTVRMITDRHSGIGADGLIRVVRTAAVAEMPGLAEESGAEWFMDYRNADGSVAEMCGNGIRVLARYLLDHGHAAGPTMRIATRGGVRVVHVEPEGQFTVEMGRAVPLTGGSVEATIGLDGRSWPATAVTVPNPHAVVFVDEGGDAAGIGDEHVRVDDVRALAELGMLTSVPTVRPRDVFPDGANVEFVARVGERHIALRVWERGVGETRSCGTGVCAAAWAAMRRDGTREGTYTVQVPGGQLRVTERPDGELMLTGPAELGVRGTVTLDARFVRKTYPDPAPDRTARSSPAL
ncbi:diaminopimelate epimerase [Actinobacteria bacterium YIM 96077]|uniref:Diaminopimelate epimerase n=1 Tax=Phytoactinopolyspora halophila TaxID=1981511 RepID=A0A329QW90_9ACTN|nr:diaminopimelate epimerase [Phytoactinopolyspora halophila]AYY12824.1 diaminopimelate epimerase [Actinobacteria bacterium YIM 96077]RAW16383.1 diaminopimelate epimerase [Phytoactinopolyspora halophila]